MASGVATRPIADIDAYRERLNEFVFRSGFIMKPLFAQAKTAPKRVVYAEGEDERVLRATQVVAEEGLAQPILIGRPQVIETRLQRFGLSIRPGRDFVLINPQEDPRYRKYVDLYIEAAGRRGVTPDAARTVIRTNATVIAAAHIRRFGIEPRIALVSHSDFGSYDTATARKMRAATAMLWERKVDFEVDGEMHADTALDPVQRERVYPHSRLKGAANALVMPTLDAANVAYESLKVMADALAVGPILIGTAMPAHVLTPSVTARGIVNMTAVAVAEAGLRICSLAPLAGSAVARMKMGGSPGSLRSPGLRTLPACDRKRGRSRRGSI